MFAVLPSSSRAPVAPSSPRMEGNLWKWTNYLSGWQQRWFVLESGILAYYLAPSEVNQGCRGSLKVASCNIVVHPTDHTRVDIVMPGGRHIYLKSTSTVERQQWVVALGTAKQDESGSMEQLTSLNRDQRQAVQNKMAELQHSCHLLVSQVANIKNTVSTGTPDTENLTGITSLLTKTCDSFLNILSECMLLAASATKSRGGGGGGGGIKEATTDIWSPTFSTTSSPTSHRTEMHTALPGKPAAFSFPHHPPHTVTTSTTPLITPSHSLPPLLPYPSPSSTGGQKRNLSSSVETSSLPANLSEVLRTLNGAGSDGAHSQTVIPNPPVESTDSGHDKGGNRETGREQGGLTLNPQLRSHSRTNSELFITPDSSPTSSPPPSPSHPHSNHLLPTVTPHASETTHTLHPPPKAARVGDRFELMSVTPDVETFFSKTAYKFEDIVLTESDGIPTAEFLNCCRSVVPFFDTLSPTAFAPVKADINGNIEKLAKKLATNPGLYHTLQCMVLHELETNTHKERNSATDALLWLKRAMEFVQVFLAEVAGGEHSLDIAAGKAYTKSLRRFHNWIVRGIFSMAARAVPYHKDFLLLLGATGPETQASVTAQMANFSRSLGEIISIITEFYQKHNLDSLPMI